VRLSQTGEFGLIKRMRRIIEDPSDEIVLGIGDDAAVVHPKSGSCLVLTTDALIEGVHFDLRYTPFDALGWKALAVNLSDVAAVGGVPSYALISLALPESWSVENVESFYRGLKRCGKAYGCKIIGGDTTRSVGKGFISISVVGYVNQNSIASRSGAQEGELLCVTGNLGGARAGLEALQKNEEKPLFKKSIQRFLKPLPRIAEAGTLIRELHVSSMIDISDGLASDAGHLCEESGLGCILWEEAIPIHPDAKAWAEKTGESPARFALTSGEEYELLFTVDKKRFDRWTSPDQGEKRFPVTSIGEMVHRKKGMRIKRGEKTVLLSEKGWDHFRK
jgi:thiamine-monophosphate kinase